MKYILTVLMLLFINDSGYANDITGPALIADGDSIKIGKHRITLDGIDAPERDQTCELNGSDVECGAYATLFLAKLINEQDVRCEILRKDGRNSSDQRQRKYGVCFNSEGVNLNALMVSSGAAIAYLYYTDRYKAEQDEAKAEKRGIWAGKFMEPYEWRKMKRRRD